MTGVTKNTAVVSASGRERKAIWMNRLEATSSSARKIISPGRRVITSSRPIPGAMAISMIARCTAKRAQTRNCTL
jgi:hypothetical protein